MPGLELLYSLHVWSNARSCQLRRWWRDHLACQDLEVWVLKEWDVDPLVEDSRLVETWASNFPYPSANKFCKQLPKPGVHTLTREEILVAGLLAEEPQQPRPIASAQTRSIKRKCKSSAPYFDFCERLLELNLARRGRVELPVQPVFFYSYQYLCCLIEFSYHRFALPRESGL